jgi:hypothetical protein
MAVGLLATPRRRSLGLRHKLHPPGVVPRLRADWRDERPDVCPAQLWRSPFAALALRGPGPVIESSADSEASAVSQNGETKGRSPVDVTRVPSC